MQLDQPAVISECDGCGGAHQSIEHWVACLIKHLRVECAARRAAESHPDRIRGQKAREAYEAWEAYCG